MGTGMSVEFDVIVNEPVEEEVPERKETEEPVSEEKPPEPIGEVLERPKEESKTPEEELEEFEYFDIEDI